MIKFEPAVTRTGRDVRLAAVRHGWSHVLRSLSIAASLTDGDFVRGIILLAMLPVFLVFVVRSRPRRVALDVEAFRAALPKGAG